MGEIPVLEDNGESLKQTGPILLRLAERYGRFGGDVPAEQHQVLRWLFWGNQKLSAHMATYRFMRTFSKSSDAAVLRFLRSCVDDFAGILEQQVQCRPLVIGDHATTANLSLSAYLS